MFLRSSPQKQSREFSWVTLQILITKWFSIKKAYGLRSGFIFNVITTRFLRMQKYLLGRSIMMHYSDHSMFLLRFLKLKQNFCNGSAAMMIQLSIHVRLFRLWVFKRDIVHLLKIHVCMLKLWIQELAQFDKLHVWDLVDLPKGSRSIGTKWVFKCKRDDRGVVVRNMPRLVVQGFNQQEGVDYTEVYASVARTEAIR
ncbi:hypothetical protein L1987_52676 [Smallanthus sonchifolius]|uniref:Uncharacterized protein n=1 Tax=Smallanthus sonchifolius TaxID=185202 RepID=A0ACB9EUY4_9ASTR|nr:hypothetical protein L1987_52676 [Smallanthus sonchifolius]